MNDDDPVTLDVASDVVFGGAVSPLTLKAEGDRGRLEIAKIGKRWFTTLRSARELFAKCRAVPKAPISGSDLHEEMQTEKLLTSQHTSSSTEAARSALDALKTNSGRPKHSSRSTSGRSTGKASTISVRQTASR